MFLKDLWREASDLYFKFIDLEAFGFPISKVVTSLFILGAILLLRNLLINVLLRRAQNFFAHTTLNVAHAITLTIELPLYVFLTIAAYFTVIFPFTIPAPDEVGTIKAYANELMIKIMGTMVSVTFFWILLRLVEPLYAFLQKYTNLKEHEKDSALNMHHMFSICLKIIIISIAIVVVFDKWGFNATGFIASLGVLGAGLAFAAKDAVANIFGSVTLTLDRFVKRGDHIAFKSVVGRVVEVGYRSTVVRASNSELISIPNNLFANDILINYSRSEIQKNTLLIRINTPIQHKNIEQIISLITNYAGNNLYIDENATRIFVLDILNGCPLLKVIARFKTGDYNKAQEELTKVVLELSALIEDHGLRCDLFTDEKQFSYAWPYGPPQISDAAKPNKPKKQKAKA